MMIIKETRRNKYTKKEYLPQKLVVKLTYNIFNNNELEYRTKNNFLQCIAIIYYHQVKIGIGLNNYVALGSKYWKTVYGGNYHKNIIEPLINKYHLIECKDFKYRTFPNKSKHNSKGKQLGLVGKRYRINPELLDELFQSISYISKGKALTAMERVLFHNQEFIETRIPDLNFNITINQEKANKWIEDNAENICNDFLKRDYVQSLPDNLIIECREHIQKEEQWSFNKSHLSVAVARLRAETKNKELFYFKDAFYIADNDIFLKQKIPALIYHYKYQVSILKTLPIEEKLSPVTLRIYSHLTNFPSKILQFININNKTVFQLDLRTSQFLIFANLINVYLSHGEQFLLSKFKQKKNVSYLKKLIKILQKHHKQLPKVPVDISDSKSGEHSSSDVTKFIRDVFYTDFYGVVQQELGLNERLLAKQVLFKLLFKKSNRPDELLKKLSKCYPVVMNIIAEFKSKDVNKKTTKKTKNIDDDQQSNFSVFLQCIEGEIFVNNILKKLRDENIPCFTRHDAIVVANGHEEKAEEITKQIFNDFGFKYNHKVEDKFWEVVDYNELENSGYLDWLGNEDILKTDYSVDESQGEPTENDYNNYEMDEQQTQTFERLMDIGLKDDYYGLVDAEFLEEISELPFLTQKHRNILHDDINNLHDGMSILQDNTNKLLRQLLSRDDGILGIPL